MNRFASFVRVSALPLVLLAGTVLGLGSYFETNDDAHLVLLLRAGPVPDLPYLPGLGRALAAAYAAAPAVPWYGLIMSLLLALATGLLLAVLHGLVRPRLRPAAVAGALGCAFLVAGLEHWLWFSHARVAALLALGGLLLAARPRPDKNWLSVEMLLGLVAVLLGCLVRPSVAGLGLLAGAPGALWLASTSGRGGAWRAAWPRAALALVAALGVWGGVQVAVRLTASPALLAYQQRDAILAAVQDYELMRPLPRTASDSLTMTAVKAWVFGPPGLVNQQALHRAYALDGGYFVLHTLPAKLGRRLPQLAGDYFPLLLLLLGGGLLGRRLPLPTRRWFWATQLYYGGLTLALVGLLKLPPRLALPLLTGWALAVLAALLGTSAARVVGRAAPRLAVAAAVVVSLYALKCGHRALVLRAEQQRHTTLLARVAARHQGGVLLMGGADELLKSLSPWQNYSLGTGPVVPLTGWPAHLPAARAALGRSARQAADAQWLLAPELVPLLARMPAAGQALPLVPAGQLSVSPELFWYNTRPLSRPVPIERP